MPKSKTSNQSFKYIDLFAGIGGMRIPFDEYGGQCVFTSEWDKFAKKTYIENHGGEVHGDITQVDPQLIPKFDLLLAGFPCQPFSNAGLKKGFEDTRGTLFFNIAKIIETHKPKAVFLENVKGLLTHDKGKTYREILRILEELGYTVSAQLHNAKDYGLPQNRSRIYIIALKGNSSFTFSKAPKTSTKLGDILQTPGDLERDYTISNVLWAGHKRRKEDHNKKGNGFGYSLFDRDSPYTSTISARYYKDGSEILINQGKGKNPRKLSPREAARLQGFPESFIISVSDGQAYKQFGNSVAVPAIRSVAHKLSPILGGRIRPLKWSPRKFEI